MPNALNSSHKLFIGRTLIQRINSHSAVRTLLAAGLLATLALGALPSVPAVAAVPSCSVSITPTTRLVGTLMTATASCTNNPDSLNFQWQINSNSSTSGMTNIAGANSSTFLITQEHFGKYFRVGVSGTNIDGTGTTAYSTVSTGIVRFADTKFAGTGVSGYQDGPGSTAQFGMIYGLTTDGTALYVTDETNKRIRKIDSSGVVSTIAGTGTASRIDGPANSATFSTPRSITYGSGKLFISEGDVFRILDLATNQVTTMKNQAAPISWSQSSTQVTLNFSKPHGFASGVPIAVSGLDSNLDGDWTSIVSNTTSLRFNVATSATVTTTAVTGATVTGVMGKETGTTASHWYNYYKAFDVGPDGHIYLGRSNSGDSTTNYQLLRFRQLSGDIFELDVLGNHQFCDFSFVSATRAYVNRCGGMYLAETSDDWATVTYTSTGITSNTSVLYTSGGYVYSGEKRLNLNNSPATIDSVFNDQPKAQVEFQDNVYWTDYSYYTNAVYVFQGGGTGITPTEDVTAPTLSSSTPSDNASGVLNNANLVLNFSENIAAGTGNISISKVSDLTTPIQTLSVTSTQTVSVTDSAVTINGSALTVDWPVDLDLDSNYFVTVDSGAVEDVAGNIFAGFSSQTTLNFSTIAAPSISSSTPSDGELRFNNTANLVLNFDRNITAQASKNLTLVNTGDASDNRVIASNDTSQITIVGSAVTINPTSNLLPNSSYAIVFDAGSFVDSNNIGVLAQTDQTVLNFTTAPFSFEGLSVALDAEVSSSYSGTGSTWTDISGSGNHLTLYNSPTFSSSSPKSFAFASSSSQYGDFVAPDLLNSSGYTKLVWFKPTSLSAVNNLFSSRGGTAAGAHAFWGGGNNPDCSADGDNLAAGHNGTWSRVIAEDCLESEWQLGVVSFSNVDGWKLYRNGVLVGEDPDTTEISVANSGYFTQIARHSTSYYFDGQISQVYLYDRSLASDEINSIFEATSSYFGLNLKTVTFDPNGGTVDLASLRTNAGDGSVTLRAPNKANATFLGWFTQASGGTRVGGPGESYTPSADITLFAQWDSTYTITYSAGANTSGAPASAQFRDSTGPVALPTPVRADYGFNGWYTAASGGTRVGGAGSSYTATSDITLHGQWTQLSLSGLSAGDLTEVNTEIIVSGVGSVTTRTIGSSSVALNVPANALPAGVVVRLYSVSNNNRAQAVLPNESDFVNSMVVAWMATDTTVPVATQDLTMVITDANIKAGAKVYSILGDQSTLLATATEDGSVTIAFRTDPLVTIANPVVVAPSNPSQSVITSPGEYPLVTDEENSQELAVWTKRFGSTVKVYAKNVVGVGKVQFFHQGREFAWVRAVDETDPKLRLANDSYYLVRTYTLVPGKNAFEIHLDGERLWRAAYSLK